MAPAQGDKTAVRFPFKLEPTPVERVWGGSRVHDLYGWSAPPGTIVGEWWVLSFRNDYPSRAASGPLKGMALTEAAALLPSLLGDGVEPALLVKIIDSAEKLSVQVHPDDDLARDMKLDSGKTECWYYLDSTPGARIYAGLNDTIDRDGFFRLAASNPPPGEMTERLLSVPVREGDFTFIPAGLIHAIGENVVLLEVQQDSDTTFRIYDWGRPRQVHLSEAEQAVVRFKPAESSIRSEEGDGTLVSCPYFSMNRLSIDRTGTLPAPGEIYSLATFLKGSGVIRSADEECPFQAGDSFFLPARSEAVEVRSRASALVVLSRQERKAGAKR